MSETTDFNSTLREILDQETELWDQHPAPEVLTAYHAGELTPPQEASFRRHLASCHHCVSLLLALEDFPSGTAKEAPLSDVEVARRWRKLEARIAESETWEAARPDKPPPSQAPRHIRRFAYPLAAALAAVSLGLAVWGLTLQRRSTGLAHDLARTAQTAAEIALVAVETTPPNETPPDLPGMHMASVSGVVFRSAAREPNRVELAEGATLLVLVLRPGSLQPYADYGVEILDRRGRSVLRRRGLRPTDEGTFGVGLAPLLAGWYRVHLFGVEDERENRIQDFEIQVVQE